MKHVIIIVLALLFSSCSKPSLSELMNKAIHEPTIQEPFSKDIINALNISKSTNVCFIFDASCSSCVSDYFHFVEEVKKCNYDSLYTIACGASDFILVEFYMNKFKIESPQNERIIFDADKTILEKFMASTGIYDVIITRNDAVIHKEYFHDFVYKEKYGLVHK